MSFNIFLLHLVQQTERLNPSNHVTRSAFLTNRLRLSGRYKKLEMIKRSFLEGGEEISTGGKMNVCSLSSELSDISRGSKAVRSPLIALKRFLVLGRLVGKRKKEKEQGSGLFLGIFSIVERTVSFERAQR